jgi:restriction system protein
MAVTCSNCGLELEDEESKGLPRQPCPKCGSTQRTFDAQTIIVGASAAISGGAAYLTGTLTDAAANPNVLIQAAVEYQGKVPEGDLIVVVWPAFQTVVELLQKDPDALFKIEDRKMEELVAASYKAAGFDDVVLTPRSGDFGIDVRATKRGLLTVRIIDQVKRFAPNRTVDANDVRALLHVLNDDRSVSKGFVTTTANFAPKIHEDPHIAPYLPTRLELVNGQSFRDRLARIAAGEKA